MYGCSSCLECWRRMFSAFINSSPARAQYSPLGFHRTLARVIPAVHPLAVQATKQPLAYTPVLETSFRLLSALRWGSIERVRRRGNRLLDATLRLRGIMIGTDYGEAGRINFGAPKPPRSLTVQSLSRYTGKVFLR